MRPSPYQASECYPTAKKKKKKRTHKKDIKKHKKLQKVKIASISLLNPSFDVIFHEEFDFEGLRP